jgi:hypothetical protein
MTLLSLIPYATSLAAFIGVLFYGIRMGKDKGSLIVAEKERAMAETELKAVDDAKQVDNSGEPIDAVRKRLHDKAR